MTAVPPVPAPSAAEPAPALTTGWAWLDRWIAHPGVWKVFKFGVVGGTGFVTDAGVLTALHNGLGLDPYTARVIAIIVATIVTWRLNRAFTFGASQRSQGHEAMRYALVAAVASGVNWLVYAACVYFTGLMPVLAVVVGCAVAMFVSYTGYNRFVFGAK
jgi:putative flippase GtrA